MEYVIFSKFPEIYYQKYHHRIALESPLGVVTRRHHQTFTPLRLRWVSESSNITAVSYIAAQLFQPIAPRQFSSTTRHATGLKVSKFKLIKPTSFLTALSRSPSPLGQNIAISKEDQLYYKALEDMKHVVRQAVKELEAPIRKGRKKGVSLD